MGDKPMALDQLKDLVYQCNRCAHCLDLSWLGAYHQCPLYKFGKFESFSGRGLFFIARALVDGKMDYDADIAERVFACTNCSSCADHCFKYIPTTNMYAAMRQDLVERGFMPPKLAALLADQGGLGEFHNIHKGSAEERLRWLPDRSRVDQPAPVAYFVGCTSSYIRQAMAVDTYQLLEKLGIDFTILSDEWCCGDPYISAGQPAKAAPLMEHNLAALDKLGVKQIVFNASGCQRAFRDDWRKLTGRNFPFEARHIIELIADRLAEGKITFERYKPKTTVTYHDPCVLGRQLGVYDAPRSLLHAIPGLTLVEMPRNRRDAYCCGARSQSRYDSPEMANLSGADRVTEAEGTGAEIIVSSCPDCLIHLEESGQRTNSRLQIMDLVQIVNRQLGPTRG